MIKLVHTSDGQLKSDDPLRTPGTKIKYRGSFGWCYATLTEEAIQKRARYAVASKYRDAENYIWANWDGKENLTYTTKKGIVIIDD